MVTVLFDDQVPVHYGFINLQPDDAEVDLDHPSARGGQANGLCGATYPGQLHARSVQGEPAGRGRFEIGPAQERRTRILVPAERLLAEGGAEAVATRTVSAASTPNRRASSRPVAIVAGRAGETDASTEKLVMIKLSGKLGQAPDLSIHG